MQWEPITRAEFDELYKQQYSELDEAAKRRFDAIAVGVYQATIRRPMAKVDELVFVVAKIEDEKRGSIALYFDDVEMGFDISAISPEGRILSPGGSQYSLSEAVRAWFP